MTQDITSLIEKLERAAKGSDYLSAHVVKTLLAPEGAWVEQSKFNGAWCVYERREKPRLWGEANPLRQAPVTTSLDAALALAERVLLGWRMHALQDQQGIYQTDNTATRWAAGISEMRGPGNVLSYAPTPALAVCASILKARAQSEAS